MLNKFPFKCRAGNHIHFHPSGTTPRKASIPPDVDACGHPFFASWARRGAMDGQERRNPIRARQGWRARFSEEGVSARIHMCDSVEHAHYGSSEAANCGRFAQSLFCCSSSAVSRSTTGSDQLPVTQ